MDNILDNTYVKESIIITYNTLKGKDANKNEESVSNNTFSRSSLFSRTFWVRMNGEETWVCFRQTNSGGAI